MRTLHVADFEDVSALEDKYQAKLLGCGSVPAHGDIMTADLVPWPDLQCGLLIERETRSPRLYFKGTDPIWYAANEFAIEPTLARNLTDQILCDHRDALLRAKEADLPIRLYAKSENALGWMEAALLRAGYSYKRMAATVWHDEKRGVYAVYPSPIERQVGVVRKDTFAYGAYASYAEAERVGLRMLWRAVSVVARERAGRRCEETTVMGPRLHRCLLVQGHPGACQMVINPDTLLAASEGEVCLNSLAR
jgi:hypothetical protein